MSSIIELTNEDKVYEPHPSDINIKLMKHQLVLLNKCLEFESTMISVDTDTKMNTSMGVIADSVGSGKSYVLLSIIKEGQLLDFKKNQIKSYGKNKIVIIKENEFIPIKTSILVIPHNIFSQWQKYVKDFGGNMSAFFISRTTNLNEMKEMNVEDIKELDIIVTTCSFYNGLAQSFRMKNIKVRRLIFDEVDSLNASSYEEIDNSFIWFVTASYKNLINPHGLSVINNRSGCFVHVATGIKKPGFVKSIFSNLVDAPRNFVNAIIVKNSDDFVNSAHKLPDINYHYIESKSPVYLNILNGIVDHTVINCFNAIDMQTAMQQIPFKNRKSENNIIEMFISKYNVQIKNLETKVSFLKQIETNTEESKDEEIEKTIVKLQELETKIQNIKERIRTSETCFICYDAIVDKTIMSCCSNSTCFKCIHTWAIKNPSCPLCKSKISKNNLFIVKDNVEEVVIDYSKMIHKNNDKFTNLINILNNLKPDSKILLFSAFDNTFNKIVSILDESDIRYSFLKGNTSVINKTITNFKNGDTQILLVNPLYYGSGLNLEMTTDIIMFHKFESEIEKQVIGRAQRNGRIDNLNLWYLLHENELS